MDPEQSLTACLCSSTEPECRNGPSWGAWCSRICLEQGKRWRKERRKRILSSSGPINLWLSGNEKSIRLWGLAEPGVGKIYALVLSASDPQRHLRKRLWWGGGMSVQGKK